MSGAAAAALRRSGSNSLSALLRAEDEEEDEPPPAPCPGAAATDDDGLAATKRPGSGGGRRPGRRRPLLRLPLGGAGGCRVCACDEADPAPPRRRAQWDGDDEPSELLGLEEEEDEGALQCFSWKKGPPIPVARRGRALAAQDAAAAVVADDPSATPLSALPDELLEMVLGRLPLSSLLSARCACRRWRDLTLAPQLLRLRREGLAATTKPWLFLFGAEGDGGWGGGASTPVAHALDVDAQRWRRVRAAAVRGRSMFSVAAVYEDPHRLSLRRLRLRDVLSEDAESTAPASHGHGKAAKRVDRPAQARQALIVVGGRGPWDEPLVSGEIYDPLTDKWVEIAGFPTDVGLACSGAVCGDTFYVYCESDTLVAYHLDAGSWSVLQTSRPPPRLRDYAPALVCCASRLFMLCVSWCDPANRRDKVVRKVFELVDLAPSSSSSLPKWAEASSHPDAPMDPNAAFAAGQDSIYAVEMFRIFGKVLDFATSCQVSGAAEQSWGRVARKNAAAEADAMSCRLKSMAVLHL